MCIIFIDAISYLLNKKPYAVFIMKMMEMGGLICVLYGLVMKIVAGRGLVLFIWCGNW